MYGKALRRSAGELASGARVDDAWRQAQIGFRTDWERGADTFSVNGNVVRGELGQPEPGAISVSGLGLRLGDIRTEGANLTGRWQHALPGSGSLAVQAYQ